MFIHLYYLIIHKIIIIRLLKFFTFLFFSSFYFQNLYKSQSIFYFRFTVRHTQVWSFLTCLLLLVQKTCGSAPRFLLLNYNGWSKNERKINLLNNHIHSRQDHVAWTTRLPHWFALYQASDYHILFINFGFSLDIDRTILANMNFFYLNQKIAINLFVKECSTNIRLDTSVCGTFFCSDSLKLEMNV